MAIQGVTVDDIARMYPSVRVIVIASQSIDGVNHQRVYISPLNMLDNLMLQYEDGERYKRTVDFRALENDQSPSQVRASGVERFISDYRRMGFHVQVYEPRFHMTREYYGEWDPSDQQAAQRSLEITAEDEVKLSGEPAPLKIIVPVEIEEG